MNFQLMNLKKNTCNTRLFIVEGTIIHVVESIATTEAFLNSPHVYKTRNAAKRAVARYRQTSLDYEYAATYIKGPSKNISKYLSFAFDKAIEEYQNKPTHYDLGTKTVKIRRIECDGLMDYKRT